MKSNRCQPVLVLFAILSAAGAAGQTPTPTPGPPAVPGSVAYLDVDFSDTVNPDDALVFTFSEYLSFAQPNVDPSVFFIPVIADSLGTGATMEISTFNQRQLIVRLGVSPWLTIPGTFSMGEVYPGAPSGIDIAAPMVNAIKDSYNRDVEDTGLPNVDDNALDILYAIEERETTISALMGGTIHVGFSGYYTQHQVEVLPGSLAGDTTFLVESAGLPNISALTLSPVSPIIGPVNLTLEYKEADVKLAEGFVEQGMRIHLWNPDTQTFEPIYGPQFVDTVSKTVTYPALLPPKAGDSLLKPAQNSGTWGNVGIPTVVRTSGSAGPEGKPLAGPFVLSVGSTGLYTLHRLTVPGYEAGPGITFVLDQVKPEERHGYGYDTGTGTYIHHAIVKVTATGETDFSDELRMEYKDASNPNWNDLPSGAEEGSMQIHAWDSTRTQWVELPGVQTVDTVGNTVTATIPDIMDYQLYSVQPGVPDSTDVAPGWTEYR